MDTTTSSIITSTMRRLARRRELGNINRLPEAFLLAAVVFGPLAFGAVEAWSLTAVSIFIYASLFFSGLRNEPIAKSRLTLFYAVLAILLVGLIQFLNPRFIFEPAELRPSTSSAYATGRALSTWALYAAVLWVGSRVFRTEEAARRLMWAVFGLGCVVAAVGIIQTAQSSLKLYGIRSVPEGFEPFGPYYNRDHAASMLIMAVFCGVGLLWDRFNRFSERRERVDKFDFAAIQGLIIFGIVIAVYGVFHARSRGALAALIAIGLFLGLYAAWSVKHRFILFVGGVALVSVAVYLSPVGIRLPRKAVESSARFRLSLYKGGGNLARDFPITGIGLGSFQQSYQPYQPPDIDGVVEHVHNDWLELLIQVGVIGFGFYVSVLGIFVLHLARRVRSMNRSYRGLACGAGAAGAAFMLHGLVDFGFQVPANTILFFALLSTLEQFPIAPSPLPARRKNIGPLEAAVAVLLGALAVPQGIASWHYLRSGGGVSQSRIDSITHAISWDANPKYYFERARIQFMLASRQAGNRQDELRKILASTDLVFAQNPMDANLLSLRKNLLRELGRDADSLNLSRIARN